MKLRVVATPRNNAFRHGQPFAGHEVIRLDNETLHGALHFFKPTQARLEVGDIAMRRLEPVGSGYLDKDQIRLPGAVLQWRSRNNRKGSP